jgi:hypothetical protein
MLEGMNRHGHLETLTASHPANANAGKYGVYSARMRTDRVAARIEQLWQLPHILPPDHPLLEAIASQQVLIEAMDEDIAARGVTDRNGKVRAIVDLRNRAIGRLQRLLEAAGATPESQRRLEEDRARAELAAEIHRRAEEQSGPDTRRRKLVVALETIAYEPESKTPEKLGALRNLTQLELYEDSRRGWE